MIARQNELLDSIEKGDGMIPADMSITSAVIDFYDGGEEEPAVNEPDTGETPDDGEIIGLYETVTEEAPLVTIFHTEPPEPEAQPENGVITGIGILTIERINARLPVTDGVTEAQLKVAVGHVPETAPIGGEGNAIIAGHRSYTYGHYFNRLGELETGDIIKYQPRNGEEMAFEVYEVLTVLPDDPAVYAEFPGERILTLHTCTPVRVASHRLLVRARRVN